MITSIAHIISILFHPIILSSLIPLFLVIFLPYKNQHSPLWVFYPLLFVGIVSLFTVYGVKIKLFSDFDVTKRKERGPFYLFVIGMAILYMLILVLLNGPKSLMVLGAGVLIGAFFMELINKKLKASIHVAAAAAFMCTLALLYGGVFFLLLLFIPVVAWSRLHIKRHTLSEAITGGVIGVIVTIALYLVVEYILYLYGSA